MIKSLSFLHNEKSSSEPPLHLYLSYVLVCAPQLVSLYLVPRVLHLSFSPPDHRPPYGADPSALLVASSMDVPKPPPIVTQSLKRKDRSPSPARRTPSHNTSSTAGSRPSPTSLPSIRHFLPPQTDVQLGERYHPSRQPPHQQPPSFSAGPGAGIPRLEFLPPPARASVERTHPGIIADSDGDGDSEQAARPKQKRRRQALSCTGQSHFPPLASYVGRHLISVSSFFPRSHRPLVTQLHVPLSCYASRVPTECKRRKIKCDR
jgi:hypothetical protein